jgi:trk/ktr system potassium uptake protein
VQLIVVGAGGVTRDLLRGLSEAWQVTVIDTDQERLDVLRGVRPRAAPGERPRAAPGAAPRERGAGERGAGERGAGEEAGGQTRLEVGDGSSRVVLERAGLDGADAVVAATGDDRANLEVCRVAKAAGVPRIAAVAAGPESLPTYRNEEFVAFSPAQLTARRLEIQLEPRRVSSAAFAEGLAQAVEFRIAADSPLIARPLRELELERTLIAAISRRGALIVPHGDTVLEEGDLVTVVCATADYPTVVRTFTTAAARFPTDFGSLVAVRLHAQSDLERLLPEAIHIVRNSAAEGLLLLRRPRVEEIAGHGTAERAQAEGGRVDAAQDAAGDELIHTATGLAEGITVSVAEVESGTADAVIAAARAAHAGVVVLPPPAGRFATVRLLRAAERHRVAVLLARGTVDGEASGRYRTILAPARETPAGRAASQAAIDLAVHGKAQLTAIAVRPPAFMAGSEARADAVVALGRMREAASVQGIHLRRMVREGNPVHLLRDEAANADLLVIGLPSVTPRVWSPGIAGHLVLGAPCSMLLVPSATPAAGGGNGGPGNGNGRP